MSASTRELSGEKAQRIVDAMRTSVGLRGAAGATFDHVAREAGVSRGLLHYYFGTKERLLVEVVRRDCDIRMQLIAAAMEHARSADEVIDGLVRSLQDLVDNDPGFIALVFEVFTSSRHNEELAAEMAELMRRIRVHLGGLLAAKRDERVIELGGEPDAVAVVLFSLADGLALRMLSEPEHDYGPTIEAGVLAVRQLIRPV
jgi:AcrR family transcriptional regulator